MNSLVRENIKSLNAYEVNEVETVAKLDANENNNLAHQLNEKILGAIMELKLNQYPDSDSIELREILARELGLRPEEIIVGCGSDQLISIIINSFVGEGDKILTQDPTFAMYKLVTQISGGTTVEVGLGEDFAFDYGSFKDAMDRENPKIIFITNPNNPTGGLIAREDIVKVIDNAKGIVVVDEAYYEFCGESVIDLLNLYPNLIVLRTLSKAYGLAGARVGYGVACKDLMDILYKVKPPYNVANLSQVAAKVCLENKDLMVKAVEDIIGQRDRLVPALRGLKGVKVFDSYGNFILCRMDKAKQVYDYLLENKVLVRYFGDGGPLANCLRISIGTKEENNLLLELLARELDSI